MDLKWDLKQKTKKVDPRIKETDAYKLASASYINQQKFPSHLSVFDNRLQFDEKRIQKILDIPYDVFLKTVIILYGDYLLTYSEKRRFNSNNQLQSLKITIEFLYTEKINIELEKDTYAIFLKMLHLKRVFGDYQEYGHIPQTALEDFYKIPFDDILNGCEEETIETFEDYYSGVEYPTLFLKKEKNR